jgi:hypothetical protein
MITQFKLDSWQEEVLKAEGNLCINSGRQVGKSAIIAIKASEYMVNHPGKKILIISVTEDQAEMMMQKILLYLFDNYKDQIAKGKDKPSKHLVRLKNKSEVKCKAVGQYGLGVLGLTIDILIPDEAAYMPDMIWQSVTPMLLTTGGNIWLVSTPNSKEGYFFDAYTNPSLGFKTFHVNSEEVAEQRPEPQRSIMLNYLKSEKARMTDLQYAQQYLAQFLEELRQLFPDSLIKEAQTLRRTYSRTTPSTKQEIPTNGGEYYLGVDVARMGKDETTFQVLEREGKILMQRENIVVKKIITTDVTRKILGLDSVYDFKRIYIDDGGLGVAVFDQLLQEDSTKRKVVAINNASRPLDRDEKRKKKILKEDLYLNLLRLMERKEIKLLDDADIFLSLKSVMCEVSAKGDDIRIYGRYTHIAEGLIRAAWCVRERNLNIYIEYNK